jgi:hypothetical protein
LFETVLVEGTLAATSSLFFVYMCIAVSALVLVLRLWCRWLPSGLLSMARFGLFFTICGKSLIALIAGTLARTATLVIIASS